MIFMGTAFGSPPITTAKGKERCVEVCHWFFVIDAARLGYCRQYPSMSANASPDGQRSGRRHWTAIADLGPASHAGPSIVSGSPTDCVIEQCKQDATVQQARPPLVLTPRDVRRDAATRRIPSKRRAQSHWIREATHEAVRVAFGSLFPRIPFRRGVSVSLKQVQGDIWFVSHDPTVMRNRRNVEDIASAKNRGLSVIEGGGGGAGDNQPEMRGRTPRRLQLRANMLRPSPSRLVDGASDRDVTEPDDFEAAIWKLSRLVRCLESFDGDVLHRSLVIRMLRCRRRGCLVSLCGAAGRDRQIISRCSTRLVLSCTRAPHATRPASCRTSL